MKVIKNFLDNQTYDTISNIIFSNRFPLFYNSTTGSDTDTSNYMFGHQFYLEGEQSSNFLGSIVTPLLNRLSFNKFIRAKLNFYVKNTKHIKTGFHVDSPNKHTVALYSINTNNGYTLFKNGNRIKSVANQLVLFDGRLKHCSVNQTDENIRVNININLECKENY
jgi:hypothetical protein|tara:strand:- start:7 stop:501 length:495 start_codon:yes stop_codon:yes gene_type:complete